MAHTEEKIDLILQKTARLIEQNNQYKKIVQDLNNRIKLLETQNNALQNELKEKRENGSISMDKEKLKKQIDKYILEIDHSIQWLSDFE